MPEHKEANNEVFKNHVSMLCIFSEHAIGALKGHFQLLKGIQVRIIDERSHWFATYWGVAGITLHAFAMKYETEECQAACSDNEASTGDDVLHDPFIDKGITCSLPICVACHMLIAPLMPVSIACCTLIAQLLLY
jgi:hypothetical protein